ncbi:hypothetical protein SCOR_23970 [Sulfidibacter corallicola]|uniref:DUF1565 domain-containing protein n=1 Tax=Sulfidibacter corallicola TaxID=2818388 RepID=A0A8A4TU20_SULCO|nr:hypothetical protein [Sulfidibacter corallicola]QTD52532.1 hypothetical protein J3U87_08670 [Sulfidibacter corallicola]
MTEENTVIFVAATGDDAHKGTDAKAPVASLARALTQARTLGIEQVLVAHGVYRGSFEPIPGIHIRGSYRPDFSDAHALSDVELMSPRRSESRNGKKFTVIDHPAFWSGLAAGKFDTPTEYSDLIFTNVSIGQLEIRFDTFAYGIHGVLADSGAFRKNKNLRLRNVKLIGEAVYVSREGDDKAEGTRTEPVRTTGKGLALARERGLHDLMITAGEFEETTTLVPGIHLWASMTLDFDEYHVLKEETLRSEKRAISSYSRKYTVLLGKGGESALAAPDITRSTFLANLVCIEVKMAAVAAKTTLVGRGISYVAKGSPVFNENRFLRLANVKFIAQSLYVSTSGKDTNPGTQSAPKRTVVAGLVEADARGIENVLVSCGEFAGAVNLRAGIHLWGGFSPDFKRHASIDPAVLRSPENEWKGKHNQFTFFASNASSATLTGKNIGKATVVCDVICVNEPKPTGAVASRCGIMVRNDLKDTRSQIVLANVKIIMGDGATGAAGKAGAPPAQKSTVLGGKGGKATKNSGSDPNPKVTDHDGTKGQSLNITDAKGAHHLAGGSGGAHGWGDTYKGNTAGNGDDGKNGGNGVTGIGGTHGVAHPDARGCFNAEKWLGYPGNDGTSGSSGSGGGGGGSGGSRLVNWFMGSSVLCMGGSGGNGGDAGNGGQAGAGGLAGAGSLGIVCVNAGLTTRNVAILKGTGGPGGAGGDASAGGAGKPGQAGGSGTSTSGWGTTRTSGAGGKGGSGGRGGDGGAGAGGNGGISVGVALSESKLVRDGLFVVQGGRGGLGGRGGRLHGTALGGHGFNGESNAVMDFGT